MNIKTTPLTGQELLHSVAVMGEQRLNKGDMVLRCGYIRDTGNPDYTRFYEALMEAKGITLDLETQEAGTPEDFVGYLAEAVLSHFGDEVRHYLENYDFEEGAEDALMEFMETEKFTLDFKEALMANL